MNGEDGNETERSRNRPYRNKKFKKRRRFLYPVIVYDESSSQYRSIQSQKYEKGGGDMAAVVRVVVVDVDSLNLAVSSAPQKKDPVKIRSRLSGFAITHKRLQDALIHFCSAHYTLRH
jgi:hypothetical protein